MIFCSLSAHPVPSTSRILGISTALIVVPGPVHFLPFYAFSFFLLLVLGVRSSLLVLLLGSGIGK